MKYDEARKMYGELIRPTEAALQLGTTSPAIYYFWEIGKLTKIEVEFEDKKTRRYCILTEINRLKEERNQKEYHEMA